MLKKYLAIFLGAIVVGAGAYSIYHAYLYTPHRVDDGPVLTDFTTGLEESDTHPLSLVSYDVSTDDMDIAEGIITSDALDWIETTFIDEPVTNLQYIAKSQKPSQGFTKKDGTIRCIKGQLVWFFIDTLFIGAKTCTLKPITPYDLQLPHQKDGWTTLKKEQAQDLMRLMNVLDTDLDHANGIQLQRSYGMPLSKELNNYLQPEKDFDIALREVVTKYMPKDKSDDILKRYGNLTREQAQKNFDSYSQKIAALLVGAINLVRKSELYKNDNKFQVIVEDLYKRGNIILINKLLASGSDEDQVEGQSFPRGYFDANDDTIRIDAQLDEFFLTRKTHLEEIASVIVHEGTHIVDMRYLNDHPEKSFFGWELELHGMAAGYQYLSSEQLKIITAIFPYRSFDKSLAERYAKYKQGNFSTEDVTGVIQDLVKTMGYTEEFLRRKIYGLKQKNSQQLAPEKRKIIDIFPPKNTAYATCLTKIKQKNDTSTHALYYKNKDLYFDEINYGTETSDKIFAYGNFAFVRPDKNDQMDHLIYNGKDLGAITPRSYSNPHYIALVGSAILYTPSKGVLMCNEDVLESELESFKVIDDQIIVYDQPHKHATDYVLNQIQGYRTQINGNVFGDNRRIVSLKDGEAVYIKRIYENPDQTPPRGYSEAEKHMKYHVFRKEEDLGLISDGKASSTRLVLAYNGHYAYEKTLSEKEARHIMYDGQDVGRGSLLTKESALVHALIAETISPPELSYMAWLRKDLYVDGYTFAQGNFEVIDDALIITTPDNNKTYIYKAGIMKTLPLKATMYAYGEHQIYITSEYNKPKRLFFDGEDITMQYVRRYSTPADFPLSRDRGYDQPRDVSFNASDPVVYQDGHLAYIVTEIWPDKDANINSGGTSSVDHVIYDGKDLTDFSFLDRNTTWDYKVRNLQIANSHVAFTVAYGNDTDHSYVIYDGKNLGLSGSDGLLLAGNNLVYVTRTGEGNTNLTINNDSYPCRNTQMLKLNNSYSVFCMNGKNSTLIFDGKSLPYDSISVENDAVFKSGDWIELMSGKERIGATYTTPRDRYYYDFD